ncbi:MgtC/SapB family protein [Lysobacter sp. GCM10012299]|uniref:MgtC/SapB family protein n=1 Tax=Lysobacter sp. GCM10012299 TaxID=3317333 RepID=UPI00360D4415
MDWTLQLVVLGDTAIAMVLGGAIGFERELKNRPAGFRTHMLVAGAAALLVGLGQLVITDHRLDGEGLTLDPLRLVEAVIAGVSFIGAGTIFGHRGSHVVAGITTAASILMVAVIGVMAGFRYHLLALAATVLTLLVLAAVGAIERRMLAKVKDNGNGAEK